MSKDTSTRKKGERCPHAPIKGGNVCVWHGGRARQVKEAAQLRLAKLVDPAIKGLAEELSRRPKVTDIPGRALKFRAVQDALDRNGLSAKQRIDVTATTFAVDPKTLSDDDLRLILTLKEKLSAGKPDPTEPHA